MTDRRFAREAGRTRAQPAASEGRPRRWAVSEMIGGLVLAGSVAGCGGRMPEDLGPRGSTLGLCPASPNCVSSSVDASDAEHAIAPLAVVGEVDRAWQAARAVVAETAGAAIETERDGYLHAVYTSRIMRYRDDLELSLDRGRGEIAVRSASRVGYGDMGVNRARVEALRAALAARGVVRIGSGADAR